MVKRFENDSDDDEDILEIENQEEDTYEVGTYKKPIRS